MSPAELLTFLNDFHRDTLALFKARQNNAQSVAAYDANNGYQQVLGRQEVHLQWLGDAIAALGGTPADSADQVSGKASRESAKSIIDADARDQKGFIDRWTPRPRRRHERAPSQAAAPDSWRDERAPACPRAGF